MFLGGEMELFVLIRSYGCCRFFVNMGFGRCWGVEGEGWVYLYDIER